MHIVRTVAMAAAMVSFTSQWVTVADAQQIAAKHKSAHKSGAAEAGAKGPDAEASLDKARRALTEGKAETAQQLASAVLISNNKDARNTARALAIRGEAYLNQGRPAEAIADLESALWVKGGLSGEERAVATAARSKAMQSGGIAGAQPVVKAPLPMPEAAPAPARPSSPPTRSASLPPPRPANPQPAWSSAVSATPAPTRAAERPTAVTPPSPSHDDAWSTARKPAPPPVEQEVAESKSSSGGITGFFSNLFGGGQSSSSEAAPATTATVTSEMPRPRGPAVSSSEPQRISSAPPRVSSAPAPRSAPVRAAAMVAPAQAAPAVPLPEASPPSNDGIYKLQLAAVRTKAEAEAMAQKARSEEPTRLSSRTFEIVEDVYGNMGRFYRVRISSFSEPTQALSVCASLRDRRMDCMVLDR